MGPRKAGDPNILETYKNVCYRCTRPSKYILIFFYVPLPTKRQRFVLKAAVLTEKAAV